MELPIVLLCVETTTGIISAISFINLFTSFFRASNIRNLPGTGLGLVVVKYFLDLHKGHIDVRSVVNQGSSFIITIPTTL